MTAVAGELACVVWEGGFDDYTQRDPKVGADGKPLAGSPLIGAGYMMPGAPEKDYEGKARGAGGKVSVGAYEGE